MIEGFAEAICLNHVLNDKIVCKGAVETMGDVIIEALADSVFTPAYFCGDFLGYCSDSYYAFYAEDWVNQLIATKPNSLKSNNYLNGIYD